MRNRKRLVIWLIVGVVVVGAVVYSVSVNRMADLDYSGRIASRSFESTFPEVVRHSKGNGAEAIFNGDTVKSECGVFYLILDGSVLFEK